MTPKHTNHFAVDGNHAGFDDTRLAMELPVSLRHASICASLWIAIVKKLGSGVH